MNKRIKDLADQAKLQPYYDAQEGDIERFAELIIKECADLFEVEYGNSTLTGNESSQFLKKHFGVK